MPLARASRLARPIPTRGRVPRLADYTGGTIVVRERKGSSPWCSLRADGPPGEGCGANEQGPAARVRKVGRVIEQERMSAVE